MNVKSLKVKILLLVFFAITAISCKLENKDLDSHISSRALELNSSADLDKIIEKAADKRLKLLGEASHGTHEYYVWRDSISRRLISEKNYSFIAVEGDWASLYELNRYVKNMEGAAESAREVLESLDRWPPWMWGNKEVEGLIEWLRDYNEGLDFKDKVGFYGMDVYGEWNSLAVLKDFLKEHNDEIYNQVKEYYDCFSPYDNDSWEYARAAARRQHDCVDETLKAVELIKASRNQLDGLSDYEYFFAKQNAYVVKYAEKFYRKSAVSRGPESWNSRVEHMFLTVKRLLDLYGENSKGIVWAHNTHVGDASATEMANRGQVNIGQLSREEFGDDNVFITGFGTYTGKVNAGRQWGAQMQVLNVPEAHRDSYEYLLNKVEYENFFIVFNEQDRQHEEFIELRGHRAIGVVYNPEREVPGNYVATILPKRYDAFIFFEKTKELNPFR